MSSSALGPFMAIAGDSLAVNVYIVAGKFSSNEGATALNGNATANEESTATSNANDTASSDQHVVLLRKSEQESTIEVTGMYQLVASNNNAKAINAERQRRLFNVSRHGPMEMTLELLSDDPNITSGQLRNRKNLTLMHHNLI
eukprot:scaffold14180_cov33-Cyclotella_meneghiniana.AAC.1